MDAESNTAASNDEIVEEILDGPLPVKLRGFGDWPTFFVVLQLTLKIVGIASLKRTCDVLFWFEINFQELKKRRRQAKTQRTELRRLLQAFPRGSRDVLGVLDDFAALSKLVDAARAHLGRDEVAAIDTCLRHLPVLRRAFEALAPHAPAAAGKIPNGKGATRDPADISAEELCAFMVGRVWQVGRGKWPGSQVPEVSNACEELWQAAGGRASKNPRAKWRPHLDNASLSRRQGSLGAIFVRQGDGRPALAYATPVGKKSD
jgi:hypothetical protein